jgi:glycosyltransferase involved in cell wall biosynthesis
MRRIGSAVFMTPQKTPDTGRRKPYSPSADNRDCGGKRKLRVLQLVSSIGFFGMERVIMTLIGAINTDVFDMKLASLEKKLTASTEIINAASSMGISASIIPCCGRLDWRAVKSLRTLIRNEGIDVLHCHDPKTRLYGLIASRMTGVPLITTQHNWTRQDIITTIVEYVDVCTLRFCHKAVGVSTPVAESMRRIFVPASRIEVISNGIDCSRFHRCEPDMKLRAALGIRPDVRIIGSVGRLDTVKGNELLLDAARMMAHRATNTAYLIVGEGVERLNLEERARKLGLSDQVFFAGYQSDVRPYLSLLDIFVLPSRREGTPMALLEAMAMGKVVVATRVGGVPDIVTSGVNGVVLVHRTASALSEALLRLLSDASMCERFANAARAHVEDRFSARRMAERYEAVYRACLVSRGQPARLRFR